VQIIHEAFACYDAAHPPFGLTPEPYVEYALGQFEKRMSRVELARTQSLSDLYRTDEAAEFTPVIPAANSR
jgi:ribonucleoside-diphosphate reductase beta chain